MCHEHFESIRIIGDTVFIDFNPNLFSKIFGGWEQSGLVLPWYYRVGHHGNTMVIPWLPWYYHGYEITEYGFTMVITMVLGWF